MEILGNIGNNNNLTKGSEREQEHVHPNVRPSGNEQDPHQVSTFLARLRVRAKYRKYIGSNDLLSRTFQCSMR